ncbi:uncharacterized protein ARMOST_06384 [Armillaria ostoyae]|uniref:Uncharacterized protein n=1 Tax=Armillaria ostoyae TaxID=47428 RepID=A0A284R2T3_ARMOS|nr:uncharacterized protein ARMOST_06384 [Armillaria ostoyae]
MLPSLYSRYVDAAGDSWDELAKAIRCSLQHDTMDEMIQLLHKSKALARGCTLPGVRQVVYEDLMDIRELLDPIPIQDMTQLESSEQIAAAILIQRVYRKVLHHRRGVSKIGTGYIFACFWRKRTKKRLKKCSPNEIDTLDDLLTQINKANRAAVNLQKQLRKLVEEVNDLVSSLPFDTSSDLSNDLHLTIKGIVAEHPQAHA